MAQTMLTTINKSGSFFREQTEAIKKISPPVAEQLDSILAAYEDVQAIIENEFQKEPDKKDKKYMLPELIERFDAHVLELGKHDKMRKAMMLAYNGIAGAVNFMTSDGARKANRRVGRGGGKRIR